MEKSIHTVEYDILLQLLREIRGKSGVTQTELAEALDITQSQWSKFERGELRMDLMQLRRVCLALRTTLPTFVTRLEERLAAPRAPSRRRRRKHRPGSL